jgi:glycosyltransferase involved in cell wall biosynthesis
MLNHLYYRFKPYLPWWLRMNVRSLLAQAQRRIYADTWPVDPQSGTPPANWPGWPDGKKFAFVITHDVEGKSGLEKARRLMELEMRLGFCSAFNFVPEGEYRVAPALRAELDRNGFEVGVHDLRHDGKLFWPQEFRENIRRINGHLHDWQAKGFRTGFMLHDPSFLNDLEVEYDASTFDTDPFEPQPGGVRTIFPFWIPRPQGGGFVELPYTLAQDSTMFFVLREKNTDVWKRKLDWIAARGGMALINIHPDYIHFDGGQPQLSEYAVELYTEFLAYAAKNYSGQYWNALPREVSGWYREHFPCGKRAPVPKPAQNQTALFQKKRAAVVLYSYYANDPRPRREAETLQQAGMEVDVICLRESAEEPKNEVINHVNVHRVSLQRRRGGALVYLAQYLWFLICSFCLLTRWRLRKKYDLVHVHNMPDFLIFSALVPKLTGAQVILDLHDPMPELLETIFGFKPGSLAVRLLKFLERISLGFADRIFTANLAFKEIFSARSCPPEKIDVLLNVPDENIFRYCDQSAYPLRPAGGRFIVMYHGSLVERNGLDIAVEALRLCRQNLPQVELHIYGKRTAYLDTVLETARKNQMEQSLHYFGPKPLSEIVQAIKQCDLGVIPNRMNAFTEINMPTRIFEYLSLGKPLVAPASRGIRDYFQADELLFFKLGDAADLAKKMEFACRQPEAVRALTIRGQRVYGRHRWNQEKEVLLQRVSGLFAVEARRVAA